MLLLSGSPLGGDAYTDLLYVVSREAAGRVWREDEGRTSGERGRRRRKDPKMAIPHDPFPHKGGKETGNDGHTPLPLTSVRSSLSTAVTVPVFFAQGAKHVCSECAICDTQCHYQNARITPVYLRVK